VLAAPAPRQPRRGQRLARTVKGLPMMREARAVVRSGRRARVDIATQRRFTGCLLLNSMRKSGSHFLMSIIANYLLHTVSPEATRFDFKTMKKHLWWGWTWEREKATELNRRLCAVAGYRAFVFEHENPLLLFNTSAAILHMYRNPLDALVSRYFYFYVNREDPDSVALDDVIDLEIPSWSWHYESVRRVERFKNLKRECYERLVRDTHDTSAEIIRFCQIRLDEVVLARAIASSAADNVRKDEQAHGLAQGNLVAVNMTESFIRSGQIGEWKSYLTDAHLARIERLLHAERISLDEFILE
jgi:hypothetical protein